MLKASWHSFSSERAVLQYGRSTGIHSNLTDVHLLTAAVYVVAKDLIEVDIADGREQREVFLTG